MQPRPYHRQCPWDSSRHQASSVACQYPPFWERVPLLRLPGQDLASHAFLRHIRECICLWSRILRYGGLCAMGTAFFHFFVHFCEPFCVPVYRCVNLLVSVRDTCVLVSDYSFCFSHCLFRFQNIRQVIVWKSCTLKR